MKTDLKESDYQDSVHSLLWQKLRNICTRSNRHEFIMVKIYTDINPECKTVVMKELEIKMPEKRQHGLEVNVGLQAENNLLPK